MKKVLIGGAAAFVAIVVTDFIIHGVLLASAYEATKDIWRADMMDLMWVSYVISLVVAFCLSWIFSKGYEAKGIAEGVRFGAVTGVMLGVGFGYGSYMSFNIPYSLALQWFLYTVVQYVLVGITLSLVYQDRQAASA